MDDDPIADRPLHDAPMGGDFEWIGQLIAEGYSLDEFDEFALTPLHWAAMGGHLEAVTALLAAGARVDAHDESKIGNTPLGEVAGQCTPGLAQLLVKFGADPTIRGWMQLNALDRASSRKDQDGPAVLKLLQSAIGRMTKPDTPER